MLVLLTFSPLSLRLRGKSCSNGTHKDRHVYQAMLEKAGHTTETSQVLVHFSETAGRITRVRFHERITHFEGGFLVRPPHQVEHDKIVQSFREMIDNRFANVHYYVMDDISLRLLRPLCLRVTDLRRFGCLVQQDGLDAIQRMRKWMDRQAWTEAVWKPHVVFTETSLNMSFESAKQVVTCV